jgi:TRAP-type C4-dicarboxylate transport system substrate-binding protein
MATVRRLILLWLRPRLLSLAPALLSIVMLPSAAAADPIKLRIATMAPEGSGWAREMHGFSRDVAVATKGRVQVHWYFGGVAGDELAALDRVRKGQLDGAGITMGCEALAPSLHVTRMAGMIRSNAEARHVLARLRPRLEKEFHHAGYFDFGVGSLGTIMVFSRTPVRTFADLQHLRVWAWDRDTIWHDVLRRLGISFVPLPVGDAARAYEEQRIDGFLSPPGPALVFQWTTLTRYFTDLHVGILPVCIVIAQRSIDEIPVSDREAFAGAAGKLADRFQDVTRDFDQALIDGMLQKQGLVRVPATVSLQQEFYEAARKVRESFDAALVPPSLLNDVLSWLADYRAEHPNAR